MIICHFCTFNVLSSDDWEEREFKARTWCSDEKAPFDFEMFYEAIVVYNTQDIAFDECVPKFRNIDQVNFEDDTDDDGIIDADLFTYIYQWAYREEATLDLLKIAVQNGFDVNSQIANQPVLVRVITSGYSYDMNDQLTLEMLEYLLMVGADGDVLYAEHDYLSEFTPIVKVEDAVSYQKNGYFTLLNLIAQYELPDEYYKVILPYLKPATIQMALAWDANVAVLYRARIPNRIRTKLQEQLLTNP